MADLAKRKRIRAGHRGSATKTMNKVDEALGADSVDVSVLSLLKLTLSEKLQTIKALDAEVLELIDDEAALVAEIEHADENREGVHSSLLKIEAVLAHNADHAQSSGSWEYYNSEATQAEAEGIFRRSDLLDTILGVF